MDGEPYKEIWEKTWEIERSLDLFHRRTGDVYYWPLFRGPLVQKISEAFGIHEPPSAAIQSWRIKRGISALGTLATEGAFSRGDVCADSILIPFSRRPAPGHVDIHSARLLREREFGRFLILNNGRDAFADESVYPPILHDWDSIRLWSRAAAFSSAPQFLSAAQRESTAIGREVERLFGRKLSISATRLAHRCAAFEIGCKIARRVIARSGAKRLFIVGRNSAPEALAACAGLEVPSIELQHGVIARYNPHYHYPQNQKIPYAPDVLLTFGSFWTEDVALPAQTQPIVIGSSVKLNRKASTSNAARRTVVLSQWTIGKRLAANARELAALCPEWEIVFRPHPLESVEMYRDFFAGIANVHISRPTEDLHSLLMTAQTQVGVYSTALYEGMALGLRTIIVALPGAEHMASAIKSGDALYARDASEIAESLTSAHRAAGTSRYYAPPVSSIAAVVSSHG